MPLLSLLATALLSIFCAPAFASLEPEFDLAGEAALTCSQTRPLEECYAPAAAAVRAYLASRPDRHKDFGSSHRLFAGTQHPKRQRNIDLAQLMDSSNANIGEVGRPPQQLFQNGLRTAPELIGQHVFGQLAVHKCGE